MGETALSKAIRDAFEVIPWIKVERLNAGMVMVRGGAMHGASKGACDIIGCVMAWCSSPCGNVGRFFALEVKHPGGSTDKKRKLLQENWRSEVRKLGGFAAEVWSVQEALDAAKRARDIENDR